MKIATVEDIQDIVPFAEKWIFRNPYDAIPDPDKIEETLHHLVTRPKNKGVIILYEKDGKITGGLAAIAEEMTFSREVQAIEVFWFAETPIQLARLKSAYEYWAKTYAKAKHIMLTLWGDKVPHGYEVTEINLRKM